MHVLLGIGMQMVMPVLGRPPQNTLLGATLSEEGEEELKDPAGRVGSMREVPVVPRPYRKDAQPIQRRTNCDSLPRDTRPDRRDAAQMYQYEWKNGRIDDVIMLAINVDIRGHVCFVHRLRALSRWVADGC